ncbi:hypothetical protein [Tenacibaculum xiamenense]|uniref:hypothetical protein n=1 Tax=Tenacibaculum xiamenense TaxID=1261553 RepID=UPI003895A079
MSAIGYAVFGTPKGVTLVSNGLFKELSLEKSLYLNNSHVILKQVGETVLLFRRLPSNLQKPNHRDVIIIGLYEFALQHGENRPGAFVGSAICFKDKVPNAEKMISGLKYLFSKVKEQVDENNRFKSIDSSGWNIKLPDSTKEFGMFEKSAMMYQPLSDTSINYTIKVNNLLNESPSIFTNLCLNIAFHDSNHCYITQSKEVYEQLITKRMTPVEVGRLFDYKTHREYYLHQINQQTQKLESARRDTEVLRTKERNLETSIKKMSTEKGGLEREIAQLHAKRRQASNDTNIAEKTLITKKDELRKVSLNLTTKKNELSKAEKSIKDTLPENQRRIQKENEAYKKRTEPILEKGASVIKSLKKATSETLEKDEVVIIEEYFEKLPRNKKRTRRLLKMMLLALAILLAAILMIIPYGISLLGEREEKAEQIHKDDLAFKKEIDSILKSKDLLIKVALYKKDGVSKDASKFKEVSKHLLANFSEGRYKKDSDEHTFITQYDWEFWEFDYTNKDLAEKITTTKPTFYVAINKELKPLKVQANFKWKGKEKISELLATYMYKNKNDIYEHLKSEVLTDTTQMEKHFLWLIEQCNGSIDTLESGQSLKLPFFKK